MPKIKLLKNIYFNPVKPEPAGKELDVDENIAKSLLEKGYAELIFEIEPIVLEEIKTEEPKRSRKKKLAEDV